VAKKTFSSIFTVVILIAAAIWFNQHRSHTDEPSKISRSDRGQVLRFDPKRAQPGLMLKTAWIQDDGCSVFTLEGQKLWEGPGDFCAFAPGVGVFMMGEKKILLYDRKFKLAWEHPDPWAHHDLQVYPAVRELFYLSYAVQYVPAIGAKVKSDIVIGLDFSGKEIFRWDSLTALPELIPLLKPSTLFFFNEGADFEYQTLHLNSVQRLEKDFPAMGPAFTKGNLLLGIRNFGAMCIVDRKTKKVLWAYRDKQSDVGTGIHSARFLNDGKIVFFRNGQRGLGTAHSEIVVIDPSTQREVWNYKASEPDVFSSEQFGHVEVMANGNFLVTDNPDLLGRAFEITPDKKIVWEWVNDRIHEQKHLDEVYQVTRIPESDVVDFVDLFGRRN
jgi:hypothetical protein